MQNAIEIWYYFNFQVSQGNVSNTLKAKKQLFMTIHKKIPENLRVPEF